MSSRRGLEGQLPLFLGYAILLCSLQAGVILSVLSSSQWPNLNLNWPGELLSIHPNNSLVTHPILLTNCQRHIHGCATDPTLPSWQEAHQQQSTGLNVSASRYTSGGEQSALAQAAVFLGGLQAQGRWRLAPRQVATGLGVV